MKHVLAMGLAPLLWLAACSDGKQTAEPAVANDSANLGAAADELDRMANELENGAH